MYPEMSTFLLQIRDEKFEFLPLLHALALEVEVDETGKQLEELKSMVERVLKRFEEEVRMVIIPWLIIVSMLFLQEHQKSLSSKRQEQRKWEEQNLRQDPPFDPRASLDSIALSRSGFLPRTGSVDVRSLRQTSFDLPPPQPFSPHQEH